MSQFHPHDADIAAVLPLIKKNPFETGTRAARLYFIALDRINDLIAQGRLEEARPIVTLLHTVVTTGQELPLQKWGYDILKGGYRENKELLERRSALERHDRTVSQPRWYLARNKQRCGPYTLSQLQCCVAAGQLQPTDMLLADGSQRWSEAGSVVGLFSAEISPPSGSGIGGRLRSSNLSVEPERHYKGKPLRYWLERLKDMDVHTQRAAQEAIRGMDEAALSGLLYMLHDSTARVRQVAAETLGLIYGEFHRLGGVGLESPPFPGSLAPPPSPLPPPQQVETAISALLSSLRDPDPAVVEAAASALGSIGTGAAVAVPALVAVLGNRSTPDHVAEQLGFTLYAIGRHAGPAATVPYLTALLNDRACPRKALVIKTLGLIGPGAAAAIPALREALQDPNEQVRAEAGGALKAITSPPAPQGAGCGMMLVALGLIGAAAWAGLVLIAT